MSGTPADAKNGGCLDDVHCQRRSSSLSSSLNELEENDGSLPPLNSSRGVEEHRADPALRKALEKLDAVRQRQPNLEDFSIEHYFSPDGEEAPSEGLRQHASEGVRSSVGAAPVAPRISATAPCMPLFSTDMLMAAARSVSSTQVGDADPLTRGLASPNLDWLRVGFMNTDISRSTSPGSTHVSSFSASAASISCSSAGAQEHTDDFQGDSCRASREVSARVRPPPVPALPAAPRRPLGPRPRVHSARTSRHAQATDSATASAP